MTHFSSSYVIAAKYLVSQIRYELTFVAKIDHFLLIDGVSFCENAERAFRLARCTGSIHQSAGVAFMTAGAGIALPVSAPARKSS
jgi:hypothetical protein